MPRESRGGLRWALPRALHPMHDPARPGVERIAMMHYAAVIPHEYVAAAPLMMPCEIGARRVRPEHIEQRFRFVDGQAVDVRVRTAAQIKRVVSRIWMRTNDRVARAWRIANVRDGRETVTQIAGA